MAYMYRNQITGFFEQAPNLSATAIRAYSDLINSSLYEFIRPDLFSVVLVTVSLIEPLMRASLVLEDQVHSYKAVLMEVIEISRNEDAEEKFDQLRTIGDISPSLSKYVQPSELQRTVLQRYDFFDEKECARVIYIIDEATRQLASSLASANATLIEADFQDIADGAIHTNNACERAFSLMDFLGRSRQNLSFTGRETICLTKANRFFTQFDKLSSSEQIQLLDKARNLAYAAKNLIQDHQHEEERLRQKMEEEERAAETARRKRKDDLKARLIKDLHGYVPYFSADYGMCWTFYRRHHPQAKEFNFLKKLLKLKKIESNGNLSPGSFTCSYKGKLLSLDRVRAKLVQLLDDE